MAKSEKPMSKMQLVGAIATECDLTKKQVSAVLESMTGLIKKSLKAGAGKFVLPGLLKIEKKKVAARPALKNWKNPFTGELQTRPAKPAYTKVVVRALKNLKGMA